MQRIWLKTATWLVAEIVLSLMGMDDLADYSEFVFELEVALGSHHPQSTLVISVNPPPIQRWQSSYSAYKSGE